MSIGNLIVGVNGVTVLYLIHCDSLLQNTTALSLQNSTEVHYKRHQMFYYKMQKCYYKLRQLLQIATILLYNGTVITNCDDFIIKCDSHYKMRRLLTNSDSTLSLELIINILKNPTFAQL